MSAPALTFILLLFISDIVFRIYIDVVQKQLKVKMRASRVAGLAYAAYRLAALNHIPSCATNSLRCAYRLAKPPSCVRIRYFP